MKKTILILLFLVLALSLLLWRVDCRDFNQAQVTIGSHVFHVALAVTPSEQARGLAGCRVIPSQSGMYFPFNPPSKTAFWMRGMKIPIDIIWIANNKVIGIQANLPPVSDAVAKPPLYFPPAPVDGVLEIVASEAARQGIAVGQPAVFTLR